MYKPWPKVNSSLASSKQNLLEYEYKRDYSFYFDWKVGQSARIWIFEQVVKKIAPTTHTRYLGILMDQHLSWDQHLKMLKQKLSRANGLLAKVRYYLSPKLLRTLYFSIFESHLRYGCQIWGQHSNHNLKDIANLQPKTIRIINFKNKYTPVEPLLKETKIMTLN